MRTLALPLVALLAACQAPVPMRTTPSFQTSPSLLTRNPGDIAVLPLEDGTPDGTAAPRLEYMRQVLWRQLVPRRYSPMSLRAVDAALREVQPAAGETLLAPAFLQRAAGRAAEEALLAVRVDRWDEGRLLAEKKVDFQFQAVLVASDGELLWSGTLSGEAKAGGLGPAPRDGDSMAESCADQALTELLNHLQKRSVR